MRDDQGNGSGQRPEGSGPESYTPDQGQFADGESFSEATDAATPPAGLPSPANPSPAGYGRPTFGQPGYGPPSYGPGQPGYGPGQPGFDPGQPGYGPGQPGYGQSAYGQPPYGQSTFNQATPFGYAGGYGPPGYLPHQVTRRRRNFLTYLIVAVVAAAAGAGVTAYFADNGSSQNVPGQPQAGGNGGGNGGFPNVPTGPAGNAGGVGNSVKQSVINSVSPGLVDISSNLQYQGSQAAATGMVISSNGLVLTNNHVIADTTRLYATEVTTHQRFQARWLGYDATDDVAVIKLVNAHNLKTVPLGNSSDVKVGDGVIAMGNADGAGGETPATGTITGLGKTIHASDSGEATSETLHGMLETNAGIIQGDSGGALANTSGRVIGMNTAAATGFGAPNMGFAIPINKALAIASKIIHGQASKTIQIGSTGFMGVLVPAGQASQSSNPQQQRQLQLKEDQRDSGFPVQPSSPACLANDLTAGVPSPIAPVSNGALIIGELCGTPADHAGIIAGDVIIAVGKDKVSSPQQLTSVMLGFKPGDKVEVTWIDVHGTTHHTPLTLIEAPPH